jgi:hypothetical protein
VWYAYISCVTVGDSAADLTDSGDDVDDAEDENGVIDHRLDEFEDVDGD